MPAWEQMCIFKVQQVIWKSVWMIHSLEGEGSIAHAVSVISGKQLTFNNAEPQTSKNCTVGSLKISSLS